MALSLTLKAGVPLEIETPGGLVTVRLPRSMRVWIDAPRSVRVRRGDAKKGPRENDGKGGA